MLKTNHILFFVSLAILSFAVYVIHQTEKNLDEIEGHLNTGVTYTLPNYISPYDGDVLWDDGYGILSWGPDTTYSETSEEIFKN